MKIVEFEQTHGTVWVNPMFVQTVRAAEKDVAVFKNGGWGPETVAGSEIRLYGQESWAATFVRAAPDEVARRLSEAMS